MGENFLIGEGGGLGFEDLGGMCRQDIDDILKMEEIFIGKD